jgi:hypothetical protein
MRAALFGSTAWPVPWGGEFAWWHRSANDLRAFGLSWRRIDAEVMAAPFERIRHDARG